MSRGIAPQPGDARATVAFVPEPLRYMPAERDPETGRFGPWVWTICGGCGRLARDLRSRISFLRDCPTPGCPGGGLRPTSDYEAARLGASVQEGMGL